jgi:mannose-6-phosphate isomerase-like protein (cupin superfamily)
MPDEQVEAFEIGALGRRRRVRRPYLEFLRRASMSAGLYVLDAGALDHQQPHQEDEVYVILEGRAAITVAACATVSAVRRARS